VTQGAAPYFGTYSRKNRRQDQMLDDTTSATQERRDAGEQGRLEIYCACICIHQYKHPVAFTLFPADRPGVHSPVGRRSKAPRRVGADIARARPVGWLRLVAGGVCGVVRPGRLASAGQGSLRSAGDLCVTGYR
jgi:hypothetical protein